MTVREFLHISEFISDYDNLIRMAKEIKPSQFVCGVSKPNTINDITMGKLMELQSIFNDADFLILPCKILLGVSEETILNEDVQAVLSFSFWVSKEVERVNKLFSKASVAPTPEEQQAGIENLKFGMFGLLDYYATRMHIPDHGDVEKVPWIRVYKCLDMDTKRMKFERRLRNIITKKRK
jgi:hypothetical protein